jgi:HSP20 family protein
MTTEVTKIKKDVYDQDENVIVPPVDIYENENEYVIKADIPGVKKENIDITIDNNELSISGRVADEEKSRENIKYSEFTLYNFFRSFNIGNDIDNNKVTANVCDGVLTLTLPKKEEVKPKKIEITTE